MILTRAEKQRFIEWLDFIIDHSDLVEEDIVSCETVIELLDEELE